MAEKRYSGEFRVRIPPELRRQLALMAAEQGVSLNRLASAKLAGQMINPTFSSQFVGFLELALFSNQVEKGVLQQKNNHKTNSHAISPTL